MCAPAVVPAIPAPHLRRIMFWPFLLFLLLAAFVLWNIWMALRDLGETGEDDGWGD